MRHRLLVFLLLPLAVAWGVPARADVAALTVGTPSEGATVSAPVRIEVTGGIPQTYFRLALEVARGAAATGGFRPVDTALLLPVLLPTGGLPVSLPHPGLIWDAAGVSGGPYSLRISARSLNDELLAQSVIHINLAAPDYSPALALSAPAVVYGRAAIAGSVHDTDLRQWSLEYVDAGGGHALGQGTAAGPLQAVWDTSLLPDGSYTLHLTATDAAGNTAELSRAVAVRNGLPTVALVSNSVPATADARLALRYSALTPVHITALLRRPGAGDSLARGEASGGPGAGVELTIPLDLSGLSSGVYSLHLQIADSVGRAGAGESVLQLGAPLPYPDLAALPPYSGHSVTLRWTLPAAAPVKGLEILRSGPGSPAPRLLASPPAGADGFTDRPDREGEYTYSVVAVGGDGQRSVSVARTTLVDWTPPVLGGLSVSPVDGVGLQLRWTPALDTSGIAGYAVRLYQGDTEQPPADLPADATSYSVPLLPGGYRVVLAATDRAGNVSSADPVTFRVQPGAIALLYQGRFQPTDVPGFIEDGSTWVPLRFFAEALGYQVLWDPSTQSASLVAAQNGRLVQAVIGRPSLRLVVAGREQVIDLPAAPRLVDGRVLVPLRALAEALGAQVRWYAETRTVEILSA